MTFDPNAAASPDSGIFGLPFNERESALVYIPVPWEATTSYGGGTSDGPAAILQASHQVDLFDLEVERPYEPGLFLREESSEVRAWNDEAKALAAKIIERGGRIEGDKALAESLQQVNALGSRLNDWVHAQVKDVLASGKIAAVIGGDHAVPFGALSAVAERDTSFGILHFDAHSDTRKAYEGFTWSHASIMYNVLEHIPQVKKLVQVGIRDFCEEEWDYCQTQGERVEIFFDRDLASMKFSGMAWNKIADSIVATLPEKVWISFDIDGLDPVLCPHTGTPVPGGLSFAEANAIVGALARSGRKIIGFDLNEVAPAPGFPDSSPESSDEWDANVGARLLYKLSAWTLASLDKASLRPMRF